jgi:hypothetical protein
MLKTVSSFITQVAQSIQSSATTGLMQILGPAAGTTRTVTIPNANSTMARTDAGQTFTGNQTVTGNATVQNSDNTQTTFALVNGTGYNLPTLVNFTFGAVNDSCVDGGRVYQFKWGISGGALGKTYTLATVTSSGTTTRWSYEPTGNFEVNTPGKGITVTSPDGLTTKTITINNSGAITLI